MNYGTSGHALSHSPDGNSGSGGGGGDTRPCLAAEMLMAESEAVHVRWRVRAGWWGTPDRPGVRPHGQAWC